MPENVSRSVPATCSASPLSYYASREDMEKVFTIDFERPSHHDSLKEKNLKYENAI